MTVSSTRALRWAAPVALVGAMGLAACGDGSSAETTRTASPREVVQGSDQHLLNQSEAIAGQVRADRAASDRLTAEAEQYERTHGQSTAGSSDEFVPGSRRMPLW